MRDESESIGIPMETIIRPIIDSLCNVPSAKRGDDNMRFYLRISLDFPGMWLISDRAAIRYDSRRPLTWDEGVETINWLNEAASDGRIW